MDKKETLKRYDKKQVRIYTDDNNHYGSSNLLLLSRQY